MRISEIEIKNFRTIEHVKIEFDSVTTLIGGNNAGKSTVLKALELFFEPSPKISSDDHHVRSEDDISVTILFSDITPSEREEFGNAVIDGLMKVSRSFSAFGSGNHLQYSVVAKSYSGFLEIRRESNGTKRRAAFNEWARSEGVPTAANVEEADAMMVEWEVENQEKLELTPIRGFFGAPNVACGKLRKKTSVHYIPAVADVSAETGDPKKSPIITLLNEVARQLFENREEVKKFIEESSRNFQAITDPAQFSQLAEISENMTDAIKKYYRDSRLLANWEQGDGIKYSYPQPTIKVADGDFISGIQNFGHGLQRAALFSIIEFLTTNPQRANDDGEAPKEEFAEAQSDIILLIEEPEIYQHPIKQQVIFEAFHRLGTDFRKDSGIRFQIIFTTHSEKFVGMNKFQSARILRKSKLGDATVNTCSGIEISKCSNYFAGILGKEPLSDDAFAAKMHIFSREMCEGFLAEKIILVEGVSDKAVIEGAYRALSRSPEAEGIAIISAEGKTKMDKPLYIFRSLGIPTYPVFDSDRNKGKANQKTGANIIIQRIVGVANPEEFPDGCFSNFCAHGENMESFFKRQCGDQWDAELARYKDEYGVDKDDICKTPSIISEICARLRLAGVDLKLFDDLIAAVDALIV